MKHLYYHHLKDLKDSKIILFKLCLIVLLYFLNIKQIVHSFIFN